MEKVKAVILASGTGTRFNNTHPKQFAKLAGLPVLVHTLKAFQGSAKIAGIVVVTQEEFMEQVWKLADQNSLTKIEKVVVGGATRQESSHIGISCCGDDTDYLLVHDSVRPFVTNRVIDDMVAAAIEHGAVDTVIPSADTIVEVDADGFISNIPDRSRLRRGQTPQAFSRALILEAHRRAGADGIENSTDDCSLVLRMGHPVYCVNGDEQNIKITYPLDLHIADKLFQLKCRGAEADADLSSLAGKVFVLIGATSGIGEKLAEALQPIAGKIYSFSRSTVPSLDVNSYQSISDCLEQAVAESGEIDFVINCSGDLIRKNVENTTLEEWEHIYSTNVTGNFLVSKAVIPIFKHQGHGSLVFVGSSSYTRGREGYAAYSSSKAALVNFCQALAEELSPWNIRVNVVSPSRVNTPLRFRNFGPESPQNLLDPGYVAAQFLNMLTADTTGSVFEIA
jgi:ribitol-5-phosphate 2-dehydrogenase (NADP+) / D-ribitol-5-phosphate cytidylyltransferase